MKRCSWKGFLMCPSCGKTNIVKDGMRITRKYLKQRYQCKSCGRKFVWKT